MVGVLFTIVPILKSKYEFLIEVERLVLVEGRRKCV
jgi:hypothetical protein